VVSWGIGNHRLIFALIPLILLIGIIPTAYSLSCNDDRYMMDRPNGKEACVFDTSISFLEDKNWELRLNDNCSTVDISNWDDPPNRHCAFLNFDQVVLYTKVIEKGEMPVHMFGSNPTNISHITVQWGIDEISLEQFFKLAHIDGMLVLKDNDIVYENYLRMESTDRHNIMSISKTTIPAVIDRYIENGMIDVNKKVSEYLPGIGSGYAEATVQQVLDMNVSNNYNDDFTDPNSPIYESESATGWRVDNSNRYPDGYKQFISEITSDDITGTGKTQYKTTNTDTLAWIIEEVSGENFADIFTEKIYQHLGAEQDAYSTADRTDFAYSGGGYSMTLRDLARYGQVWANEGMAQDGTQVISKEWIEELRTDELGTQYSVPNYRYHNQMKSDGNVLTHLGQNHQIMFADLHTKVVVVAFGTSTHWASVTPQAPIAMFDLAEKISKYLSE